VTLVIAVAVGLFIYQQSRPRVEVASGETPAWSASVYETLNSGVCVELVVAGRDSESVCGLDQDNAHVWRPEAPPGEVSFLVGTTADAAASRVLVHLSDGSENEMALAVPGQVTALKFYVVPVDAGMNVERIDIVASDGETVESLTP
jgi:hypothetical protein